MKTKTIFFCILIMTSYAVAQNFTEKFNLKLQRYDYYDLEGKFIGFAKQNMRFNRLEFYDSTGILLNIFQQNDLFLIRCLIEREGTPDGIKIWNQSYQRYDVLDSLGEMVGYYKYNPAGRNWQYFWGHF